MIWVCLLFQMVSSSILMSSESRVSWTLPSSFLIVIFRLTTSVFKKSLHLFLFFIVNDSCQFTKLQTILSILLKINLWHSVTNIQANWVFLFLLKVCTLHYWKLVFNFFPTFLEKMASNDPEIKDTFGLPLWMKTKPVK